jgi:hypothetical protein
MSASTRRLLLAVLAWPAGFVAAVVWMLASAPPNPCDPGASTCAMTATAASANQILEFLALAGAPGLFATIHWWRHRGRRS